MKTACRIALSAQNTSWLGSHEDKTHSRVITVGWVSFPGEGSSLEALTGGHMAINWLNAYLYISKIAGELVGKGLPEEA